MNVEATVKVDQKYSDTEANADQISAYKPLVSVNLITRDKTKSAALTLTESKTSSGYEWANSNSSIDVKNDAKNDAIEVSYKISSSISTSGDYTKLSSLSFNKDNIMSVTLPVVPFSETASYIVTYKVTITVNGTARVYYCNYEVKNDTGIAISDGYKDQTITVGQGAQSGTNLTIFKQNITDNTALFTSGDTPSLLQTGGAEYIRFENIVDAIGSRDNTGFMEISDYSISLGSSAIFSNSMTFDIVFYDSTKTTELYRSTGWTMTATDSVTPKNSKALLDIFTEAELGNDLLDKNFVAVISSGKTTSTGWFNNASSVGTANFVKTIEREAGTKTYTYTIYSFTAIRDMSPSAFYNLQGTFYFISGEPTDFIVTDNWYISYIVKDSSTDLTIDIKNNAQVFKGEDFTTGKITGIEAASTQPDNVEVDNGDIKVTIPNKDVDDNSTIQKISVTISGTKIVITEDNLELLKENNTTSCEFYITISGGSTSRTVKVVITFDFA